MRGGAHEPMASQDILAKYRANARYGGWDETRTTAMEQAIETIAAGGPVQISMAAG